MINIAILMSCVISQLLFLRDAVVCLHDGRPLPDLSDYTVVNRADGHVVAGIECFMIATAIEVAFICAIVLIAKPRPARPAGTLDW